jgi:threonyl-tRNA synthetase
LLSVVVLARADQVRVITLNDDEALIAYAEPIVAEFRANLVRVNADFSAASLQGEPFKRGMLGKFPASSCRRLQLDIGDRDTESGAVSMRLHHGGPQGAKPKGEVVADILARIRERRA